MSVADIYNVEQMTDRDGLPVKNSLKDPRLGTADRTSRCETCNGDMNECPGHFGSISLASPVFHPGFLRMTQKILLCVCFSCSKLKTDAVSTSLTLSRGRYGRS